MTGVEERVGRAAHEAWKLWIVQGGYADHAWHPEIVPGRTGVLGAYVCGHCDTVGIEHHPDMVPWEELSEEKRGKYIGTGMAGYELGVQDWLEVLEHNLGEGIHTGFRKGIDHPIAGQIHKLIASLPGSEWATYVSWVNWALAFMFKGTEAKEPCQHTWARCEPNGVIDTPYQLCPKCWTVRGITLEELAAQ